MTIAVAVRTSTAVVFAADSKLTTRGLAGIEEDRTPRWVDQTYDNATKVVQDRSGQLMAMVAGNANIGRTAALDFVEMYDLGKPQSREHQQELVENMLLRMDAEKKSFWSKTSVPPPEWPGPTMILATYDPDEPSPRVWQADLSGPDHQIRLILTDPGLRLEGSYHETFSLLFGWRLDWVTHLAKALGKTEDETVTIINGLSLRPVDQIDVASMPLQDAIDLAVFLASVQIEMDRFMPGTPACGGPIDVMVMRCVPKPAILSYPGKALHHPHFRAKMSSER